MGALSCSIGPEVRGEPPVVADVVPDAEVRDPGKHSDRRTRVAESSTAVTLMVSNVVWVGHAGEQVLEELVAGTGGRRGGPGRTPGIAGLEDVVPNIDTARRRGRASTTMDPRLTDEANDVIDEDKLATGDPNVGGALRKNRFHGCFACELANLRRGPLGERHDCHRGRRRTPRRSRRRRERGGAAHKTCQSRGQNGGVHT